MMILWCAEVYSQALNLCFDLYATVYLLYHEKNIVLLFKNKYIFYLHLNLKHK